MIRKFGRVVDLEALQTLTVNMTLEELKEKIDINNNKFHRRITQREVSMCLQCVRNTRGSRLGW